VAPSAPTAHRRRWWPNVRAGRRQRIFARRVGDQGVDPRQADRNVPDAALGPDGTDIRMTIARMGRQRGAGRAIGQLSTTTRRPQACERESAARYFGWFIREKGANGLLPFCYRRAWYVLVSVHTSSNGRCKKPI